MRSSIQKPPKPPHGALDRSSQKFQQVIACLQNGQLASAQALCADVLKHEPKHVDALHVSGLIALQTGNARKAVELIGRALLQNPNNAAAHCNRASAFQALDELDAALESYNQAIVCEPGLAEAYFNRGIVLQRLQRSDEAIASHSRAIALKPDFSAAYHHRGLVLQGLNQPTPALASFNQAIAANAKYAEAYCARGVVLRELGRPEEALASYDQAIAINPRYAEAYTNRGNVLRQLNRWEAALASYDAAIEIRPDLAEAHCNRGNVQNELNQWAAAVASYDRAIGINGQYVEAYCNKAVALLLAGDFDAGWRNYEWRRKRHPRKFSQPAWRRDLPLTGKTILLYSEQGFGDTLQFCRYAGLVSALGARVVLEVPRPLKSLMTALEGVCLVVESGEALPPFDYHYPLLSLPFAFETRAATIPAYERYLHADPARIEHWQTRLGKSTRPRVGLVWAGSAVLNNNRSIELADWIPHLPFGLDYVCLQKDIAPGCRSVLLSNPAIRQFADELDDFGDTAALCECMDLIISIDTSVAHLGGALGKPTWILLPFNPDWRWLLERQDSPWYPTVTLYRQATLRAWGDVFEQVKAGLLGTFFDPQNTR